MSSEAGTEAVVVTALMREEYVSAVVREATLALQAGSGGDYILLQPMSISSFKVVLLAALYIREFRIFTHLLELSTPSPRRQ
jgi:hypothetical protein